MVVAVGLLGSSCSTTPTLDSRRLAFLQLDMARDEVVSLLGPPESAAVGLNPPFVPTEVLRYRRPGPGHYFYIHFSGGMVEYYGPTSTYEKLFEAKSASGPP